MCSRSKYTAHDCTKKWDYHNFLQFIVPNVIGVSIFVHQKMLPSQIIHRVGNKQEKQEVNRRTLVTFRENGLGFNGTKIFCCFMNMPEPMAQTTYDEINSELHNAYVGTESVEKAAHEICDLEFQNTASTTDIDSILDTKVSGDGVWQKIGHSSLNGVVTLIGNGKCIDHEVLSKKM